MNPEKRATRYMKKKPGNRMFDSMKAAAAGMGLSIEMLKMVKEMGSTAFVGSRVSEKQLLKDVEASGLAADATDIRQKKLFEEWRKLKIVNDKRDGLLVEKSKVKESISRFNVRVDSICSRYENEWPSVLAGLEPPAIRAYLKRGMDQIRQEISDSYGVWIC